jgi:hypothetical protein
MKKTAIINNAYNLISINLFNIIIAIKNNHFNLILFIRNKLGHYSVYMNIIHQI